MTRRYRRRKGHRKAQTWEEGTQIVRETHWETKPLVNGKKKRKKVRKETGEFLDIA